MAAPATTSKATGSAKGSARGKNFQRYAIIGALIIMALISTVVTGGDFAQPLNLMNIAVQVTTNGILAVGMTFIIITGGIDLSVGSMLALIGVICAKLMGAGLGTVSAVAIALLASVVVGLWNGTFVAHFRIPPFIVTLGTMTAARGLALLISGGRALAPMTPGFNKLASTSLPKLPSLILVALIGVWVVYGFIRAKKEERSLISLVLGLAATAFAVWILLSDDVRGLPTPILIFGAVAVIGSFLLNRTTFGRHLLAIGGNEKAAKFSGINVKWALLRNYVLSALLAGMGGLVLASRLASGVPTAGNGGELDAVAAVVIGGTSLAGGSGTIAGTIVGVFIIGMLNNVLVILNVDSNFQYIVKGLVIMAAVLLDATSKKQKD